MLKKSGYLIQILVAADPVIDHAAERLRRIN